MKNMAKEKTCRICGEDNASFAETGRVINGYKLYQCLRCKTFMVFPSDTDRTNSGVYDELFGTGEYEMHRKQFELLAQGKILLEFHRQRLLKHVEKFSQGRNLVEIGGGTGSFGIFCERRGWKYVDFDISSVAVEYAKKLGLQAHVIADPTNPILPQTDALVMWEALEHIWNVRDYLENIKKSLDPNGLLIMSTPNYYRRGYRISENWGTLGSPPVHVNFFTKESITATLKSAGFGYVRVITPRFYRPALNLKSIWYRILMAVGFESAKTLYVIAGISSPNKVRG